MLGAAENAIADTMNVDGNVRCIYNGSRFYGELMSVMNS